MKLVDQTHSFKIFSHFSSKIHAKNTIFVNINAIYFIHKSLVLRLIILINRKNG